MTVVNQVFVSKVAFHFKSAETEKCGVLCPFPWSPLHLIIKKVRYLLSLCPVGAAMVNGI